MSDVVVTCPQSLWQMWLDEGDLPSEPWSGDEYHFYLWGARSNIAPGERVYVVAYGRLRGYAPLVRIARWAAGGLGSCGTATPWPARFRTASAVSGAGGIGAGTAR